MTYLRTVIVALACALVALAGGLWLGGHPGGLPGFVRDAFVEDDRALQAEIADQIEDDFYKKVSDSQLRDRSLKALVESLGDPFSQYLTPSEARTFVEASVNGRFEGVGMTVEEDRRGLRVLSVFRGSPARNAGIRQGDLIIGVNGRPLTGVSSNVATGRIKGPAGTVVRLEVLPEGKGRPRVLRVRRQRIKVPVVESSIKTSGATKLGYVRLLSFNSGAHAEVRRVTEKVLRRGAKGLVLDLRGNGGGLLKEGVLVASAFIEDGTIVSVRGRSRPNRTETAEGKAVAAAVPMVVLVDGGSASASEIVSGALRDRKRATLVGTRTFGKGLVQELKPLSNGGVLDLTVARYYLPSNTTIEPRKGLVPEVKARDNPRTDRDEALPLALDALRKKVR